MTRKHKFIVSNTKHIENKSYTALENKYSYRSSKIQLYLQNEMNFRLLKRWQLTVNSKFNVFWLLTVDWK